MSRKVIYTDRVMEPIAHFSHAVRVGNIIHLGATAGTDAARRLAGATPGLIDFAAQTQKMFDNARVVLELLGADLGDVLRVKTYVTDVRDIPLYTAGYDRAFEEARPSHTIVGSAGFPLPQAGLELDLVAAVGASVERFPGSGDATQAQGRLHCAAGPAPESARDASSFLDAFRRQADSAFGQLKRFLAGGGRSLAETVYLHATLSDARLVEAFRKCFQSCFPESPPACTIVIASLERPEFMLHLEEVALAGGGTPIAGDSSTYAGPGSPAVLAGDELYVGGQYGVETNGKLALGVEAQTLAAWNRVGSLLEAAGMTRDHILRTNNILTDWRSYGGFNAGYGANVSKPYPPRATVLGSLAMPGALVQIEGIAHRAGNEATIVQAGAPG
jgi:2-iminobutanoate/2-iminopropanoate deaminase